MECEETVIKAYKKERLLGSGASGKAYLVSCDEHLYVMKVIKDLCQEAEILKSLNHPNIVQYYETFTDSKDRFCIIMEYANGGTLQDYIKSRTSPIPEAQILDWFTQLAQALSQIHSKKIIHRDIKSANVFLHDGAIKLGDFGIARSVEMTLAKTFIGTPYYISPEIVQSQPYSVKSDVWSLGILLYEMCTLKYPFQAESIHQLALKIMKCKYTPISAQQYSQGLKNLIQSLLVIDPVKRLSIEQVIQLPIIQNRFKNIKVEPVAKKPVNVVIKKDEYKQKKLEEQRKHMREDIKQKKQQRSGDIIIEQFGSAKQQQQDNKTKKRDIPVQIYLPFGGVFNEAETDRQQEQTKKGTTVETQRIGQEQNTKKLSFQQIEKMRMALESTLGTEPFYKAYNIFRDYLEQNTVDQMIQTYGPGYEKIVPFIEMDVKQWLPMMITLITSESEADF